MPYHIEQRVQNGETYYILLFVYLGCFWIGFWELKSNTTQVYKFYDDKTYKMNVYSENQKVKWICL